MASKTTAAGSAPDFCLTTSTPLRCAQISSCSIAAARKVSAAHSTTLRFSCRSRFASLPMLVVLPAPLTPTMKITRVPAPFGEAAMPLAPAASGLAEEFRMRTTCDLISPLSCAVSESALRSNFSRTASRISRVGFTPRSAESSAVSSFLSSEGSILRSPRKIVSTVSESAALVLLTEFFSFSRNVGSGSFLPNREIIGSRAIPSAQPQIVADAVFGGVRSKGISGNCGRKQLLHVHFDGAEAELAVLNGRFERCYDDRIELRAGQPANFLHGVVEIHGRLVGAVGGHGIERIGHADDARHQRNLRS